jgi:hypothetical protein
VFSQAHLRAYFIGIVKLAFVTPAKMRVAIPDEVLLMMGFLPLCLGQGQPPGFSRAPKSLAVNIEHVMLIGNFYHVMQHNTDYRSLHMIFRS